MSYRQPVSLEHVQTHPDGPLLRVTDLMRFTGLSRPKVLSELTSGRLHGFHVGHRGCYFIGRRDALAWLSLMGIARQIAS